MLIRFNKIHVPVTALGPGRRIGLWLQGCSLHCHGCLSKDTWSHDEGTEADVDGLVSTICTLLEHDPELIGLTISGGEPFEQAPALTGLIRGLRFATVGRAPAIDILCYSGLHAGVLRERHPDVLDLLDALVPEPFVESRAPGLQWRGSTNQPVMLLTDLARERYVGVDDPTGSRPFQVMVDDDGVWMIGVPGPGDLERLTASLSVAGYDLEDVSWR